MKLEYWYSRCPDDGNCYSVREKTKKLALAMIAKAYQSDYRIWPNPVKVAVEYTDSLDLLKACMEEDTGYWEA